MNDPVFSIHVGQNSRDCRVMCNGHDISRAIRKIVFTAEAASLSSLTLTAAHGSAVAEIQAAIADVKVIAPTTETTKLYEFPDVVADSEHHVWANGAMVCNCGDRRKAGVSKKAPPGWPGNPSEPECSEYANARQSV